MSDENVILAQSFMLSGTSKLNEIVKKFNQNNEYFRFIFNGENLYPNDKVIIAPLYNAGHYQRRNLILSREVNISEMLKAYNLMYGYEENNFNLISYLMELSWS